MSRAGYRSGFNPFRRGGTFASPTAADRSSDAGAAEAANGLGVANKAIGATGKAAMNNAIRAAAGRGGEHDGGASDVRGVTLLPEVEQLGQESFSHQ